MSPIPVRMAPPASVGGPRIIIPDREALLKEAVGDGTAVNLARLRQSEEWRRVKAMNRAALEAHTREILGSSLYGQLQKAFARGAYRPRKQRPVARRNR